MKLKEENCNALLIRMPNIVFDHLIDSISCECAELNGTIGFASEHGLWSLNFYADTDKNTRLIIQDFGFIHGEKWEQLTPTAEQSIKMQKLIDEKFNELTEEQENEAEAQREADEFASDPYAYNGVRRSYFI